jgi:tetraacyldisaccharide 4'-kinase
MPWPENHWYRSRAVDRAVSLLLWPASLLYGALAALRRAAYRQGLLHATHLPVPVVVVGNLSVGGTGKTPLALALAAQLRARGFRPGLVSRGYGGSAREPQSVSPASDPRVCGDEPVLLARRSGCPVWIGADRAAAAQALLAAHPQCDLVLCDDGLQHYALARDFEIAVIDGMRGLGNGRLLPAGPLREPRARLAAVDAVVVNGAGAAPPAAGTVFRMTLQGTQLRGLRDPDRSASPAQFAGVRVHAVAAIGNPRRFFDHLRELGIDCSPHAYPDHHAYTAAELDFGDDTPVIMTEKDAVKCRAFADDRHWVLQVEAVLDGDLAGQIARQLGKPR